MKRLIMGSMVAVLFCFLGYCGYRYYDEAILPEKRIEQADEVQQELFQQIKPNVAVDDSQTIVLNDTAKTAETVSETAESDTVDSLTDSPLAAAQEVNDGTVGWITIPGTYVDYPIAQSGDNSFYLQHGFAGDFNWGLGCPFLDYRCEGDFSGYNSIVYAHHLTGRRMFADIALYKDENFMTVCPRGFLTAADGVHEVRFVAYLTVPSNDYVYEAVKDEDMIEEYAEYLLDRANYTKDITLDELTEEGARLLLLSTCTYETEETRGVLVGVIE